MEVDGSAGDAPTPPQRLGYVALVQPVPVRGADLYPL